MKTVASISFRDNKSVSMDIESVTAIEMGAPLQVDEATWFCELLLRTVHGTVALQLTADSPERFQLPAADG